MFFWYQFDKFFFFFFFFFIGQYLNFHSHQCKERNRPLPATLSKSHQQWRSTTERNGQLEGDPPSEQLSGEHTSPTINLDHKSKEDTREPITVSIPYVRGLAEKIQKICNLYDIMTTFRSESTLRRHLLRVKPPTEYHITKNCVYTIPCSCGKVHKGETCHPLKVRLEEHRETVVRGEIEKLGMADHIWREKGNNLPLWEEVEIEKKIGRGDALKNLHI